MRTIYTIGLLSIIWMADIFGAMPEEIPVEVSTRIVRIVNESSHRVWFRGGRQQEIVIKPKSKQEIRGVVIKEWDRVFVKSFDTETEIKADARIPEGKIVVDAAGKITLYPN